MWFSITIVCVFLAVLAMVYLLGQYLDTRFSTGRRQSLRRVRELDSTFETVIGSTTNSNRWERFKKIFDSTGQLIERIVGSRSSNIRTRLDLAGYESKSTVVPFNVIRIVLVIVLCGAAIAFAWIRHSSWMLGTVYVIVGGLIGYLLPSMCLNSLVKRRHRRIRHALPDALDMMVLCVEGGGSLSAAVTWVSEEIESIHAELGREMVLIQHEMQLGLSAGEAFHEFATRCGLSEVRDLAATILQSERYGASIAKTLRGFSDSARQDRQFWAEEMAQKASVKILFPMLLCIFPAMFIVILGPASMQMSKLFVR